MSEKYVQGGAEFPVEPGKKPTKAGLKKAVKEQPDRVMLYATSSMGPQFSDTADKLPEGTVFTVVGPDPYSKRDWYANVSVGRGGKLVVA
jgi:hypothetical protein